MDAEDRRLDQLAEADKRRMSSLGIPAWAQVTGNDDWLRPRLFVWVDDAMVLHSRLVGDADTAHLRHLEARASEVLSGRSDMRERGRPVDIEQPAALAVVHEHAVGHGSMGRASTLSLAEVVAFAQDQLGQLLNGGAD